MEINFYLKAVPNYKGELRVLQFISAVGGGKVVKPDGQIVDAVNIFEQIDKGIIEQHPKEYAVFNAYVDANDSKLYNICRAKPGVPLNITELMNAKPVVVEHKKVVKKEADKIEEIKK